MTVTVHDDPENHDRIYPKKMRLATDVILQLGEDPGTIPDSLETELWIFRDRVERALLMVPAAAVGILPRARHRPADPAGTLSPMTTLKRRLRRPY